MIRSLAWFGVTSALALVAAGCAPQQTEESVDDSPAAQALCGKQGGKKHDKGDKGDKDHKDHHKVKICHVPPGNPANAHTIEVDSSAVPAHLAHGDNLGKCAHDHDDDDDDDDDDDGGGSGGSGGGTGTGTGTTSTTWSTTTTTTITATDTGTGTGTGTGTDTWTETGTTTWTDTGTTTWTDTGTTTWTWTDSGTTTWTDTVTTTSWTETGTTTTVPACFVDAAMCSTSSECCSGLCGGSGECTATCTIGPEFGGSFCSQTEDCCEGACIGGACFIGYTCILPGQPAVVGDFCCFDFAPLDGICQ